MIIDTDNMRKEALEFMAAEDKKIKAMENSDTRTRLLQLNSEGYKEYISNIEELEYVYTYYFGRNK